MVRPRIGFLCAAIASIALFEIADSRAQMFDEARLARLLESDSDGDLRIAAEIISRHPKESLTLVFVIADNSDHPQLHRAFTAVLEQASNETLAELINSPTTKDVKTLMLLISVRVRAPAKTGTEPLAPTDACAMFVRGAERHGEYVEAAGGLEFLRRRYPDVPVSDGELQVLLTALDDAETNRSSLTPRSQAIRALRNSNPQVRPRLLELVQRGDHEHLDLIIPLVTLSKPIESDLVSRLIDHAGGDRIEVKRAAITGLANAGDRHEEITQRLLQLREDQELRDACDKSLGLIATRAKRQTKERVLAELLRTIDEAEIDSQPPPQISRIGGLYPHYTPAANSFGRVCISLFPNDVSRWAGTLAQRLEHTGSKREYITIMAYSLRRYASITVPAVKSLVANCGDASEKLDFARGLWAIEKNPDSVFPIFMDAVRDESLSPKGAAALRMLGPQAAPAVPELARLLDDDRYDKSQFAIVGVLERIGPEASPAVPAILRTVEKYPKQYQRSDVMQALGAIGPGAAAAVPWLMRAAVENERSYPNRAVEALAAIGPAANPAIPILQSLTQSTSKNIAKAAREAIDAIQSPTQ